jgi:hypothetical protein
MHRLIRILVFAQTADEALAEARRIVRDELVGPFPESGASFDYAVDFTGHTIGDARAELMLAAALESSGVPVECGFAAERLGNIPAVAQVSTTRQPCEDPSGMEQAKYAMDFVFQSFKENMQGIRYLLATFTDEELFSAAEISEAIAPSDLEMICQDLAGHDDGYLYFQGRPITGIRKLQAILNYSNPSSEIMDPPEVENMMSQKLWIVPFDVHS